MCLGYAAGKAATQYVNNDLTDSRDVDIATLQTDIEIADTITRVEALYQYNPYI